METNINKITFYILIIAIVIIIFNFFQLNNLKISKTEITSNAISNVNELQAANPQPNPITAETIDVIPKGIPVIYGGELGVSFDDISAADQKKADATIKKIGMLDDGTSLSKDETKRYIQIAGRISCEYCCGADSIITNDGKAACGCSHSFAMRGLAKYLIKYHGTEYTDDQILEELGKWKTLFFPENIAKKAGILKEKGIELNYINLASNKYRDIEQKNT